MHRLDVLLCQYRVLSRPLARCDDEPLLHVPLRVLLSTRGDGRTNAGGGIAYCLLMTKGYMWSGELGTVVSGDDVPSLTPAAIRSESAFRIPLPSKEFWEVRLHLHDISLSACSKVLYNCFSL